MNPTDQAIFSEILSVLVIVFLAFCVLQARRANEDSISQIDKFGDDQEGKLLFALKVLTNFYLVVAAGLLIAATSLGLLSRDIFPYLFIGVLVGLGVKLVTDITAGLGTKKNSTQTGPSNNSDNQPQMVQPNTSFPHGVSGTSGDTRMTGMSGTSGRTNP